MGKKQTIFNIISLFIIVALVFILLAAFHGPQTILVVEFADKGLEKAVREAIDKQEGDILTSDVEVIQILDASGNNIRDLGGIEALYELTELNLENNFVKSLSPIMGLTKLQKLNLRNNEITKLSDVDFQDIIHLYIRNLSLRHNVKRDAEGNDTRLSDISMLGRMASLRKLDLRDNDIRDLTPLSNLRRLTELDLRENKFTTIEPLETLTRLRELNLRDNKIESLEPIKNLSRLIYLNIHSNVKIKSLDPISGLVNLETLIMRNVPVKDTGFLKKLIKLQRLNAIDTGIEKLPDKTDIENLLAKGALTGDVRPVRMLYTKEAPVFSHESGFYNKAFYLEISSNDSSEIIYYTLDGSEPDLTSLQYSKPIEIKEMDNNTATIVRATVFSENNTRSETVTHTFFG